MVWTAGNSPLYKCVEKFNNTPREERSAPAGDFCAGQERGNSAQKPQPQPERPSPAPKPCAKQQRGNSAQKPQPQPERPSPAPKPCTERHGNPVQKPQPQPERLREAACPPPPAKPPASAPGNLLQRLTSDRDFMLVAALIVLLLHEKADMKLIAALAFIILT